MKSTEEFIKSRMEVVDGKHLSVDQRASLVNSLIFHALGLTKPADAVEQPLYWDLICYSMEMLSIFIVQTCEGTNDYKTIETVKRLNAFIYSIHYSLSDNDAMLGPGREEHEEIWLERLERLDVWDNKAAPPLSARSIEEATKKFNGD